MNVLHAQLAMSALCDENIPPCGGIDDSESIRQDAQARADAQRLADEYCAQDAAIVAQQAALASAYATREQELVAERAGLLAKRDELLALRAKKNKDSFRRLYAAGHVFLELKAAQDVAEKADRPDAVRTKFTLKLYGPLARGRRWVAPRV